MVGVLAAAEAFVVTLDGSGYVGVALDAAGNLYTAEGVGGANHIVRYTGIADGYPGLPAALLDNFGSRADLGDAGAASFFADLAIDGAGNLWVSDAANHRVVVFDAAQLGAANTFHVLSNVTGQIAAANTTPTLGGFAQHLFASPEGVDFDMHGNLWVANNNDGANNVQNTRTSLVQLTPALQGQVLATAPGASLQPDADRGGIDFFIYQVPNIDNDAGPAPQFGGLQIDRAAARIYVNEEIAGRGRGYDISSISAVDLVTSVNDLDIRSTNPGNGGLTLVDRPILVAIV